ncbi:uncharacterized protein LOC106639105 [Copidosoma floridanum]|uniref:uncharacterized protein LOC106639105 n=1 Tax=Copidosoma floridanum TaxID=29053 RepID=UPI0006C93BE6|nr:uncharacterized protein LOC106639105 [Copidosoma floridanum]
MIFLTGVLRDPFSYDSLKSSMENLLSEGLKYTREDLDRQKYFNSIIHKVYAKTRCRYIFLYSDVMTLLIGLHFVPVYINFVEHQLGNKTFDAPHEFVKLSNTSLVTIIITLVAFLCIILQRLVFVLEAKARRYLLLPWFIFFVCLAAYHCYFGVSTFFYYPWEHKRFLLLISNGLFFKLHIEMCKGMYQYYKLISDERTGISDENSYDHND